MIVWALTIISFLNLLLLVIVLKDNMARERAYSIDSPTWTELALVVIILVLIPLLIPLILLIEFPRGLYRKLRYGYWSWEERDCEGPCDEDWDDWNDW